MKPHKHAEFIKAWADGAEIQVYDSMNNVWANVTGSPLWCSDKYRIKPEPKPDVFAVRKVYYDSIRNGIEIRLAEHWEVNNVRFTFDGETGQLKAAEVLK